MASRGGLSGLALAEIAAGVILAWSGIENASLTGTVGSLLGGKKPASDTGSEPITPPAPAAAASSGGGSTVVAGQPPSASTVAGYKAYAVTLLAAHGWAGQWSAFNNIVEGESGWNPQAKNPSSGAYGIAQALGHGTASTAAADGENNYGNFGTPDSVCKEANGGSGTAQLEWMCNYIAETYRSPNAAWAYHQEHSAY